MKNRASYKGKALYILIIFCYLSVSVKSQVTIGASITPNPNALLDLKEAMDGSSTKGLLLPRVNLTDSTQAAPLSKHVEGMMVYSLSNSDGVCINDGSKWRSTTLVQGSVSGQFLRINSSLKPVWEVVSIPLAQENKFILIETKSISVPKVQGLTLTSNDQVWNIYGNSFSVTPRSNKNRLIVTVQTIVSKEYQTGSSYLNGWVSYNGGIFINNDLKASRIGRLAFKTVNNRETFQTVTLHFVIEDLPISQQDIQIKFRRNNSSGMQSGKAIYIGTRANITDSAQGMNDFLTNSIISYQYYEDKGGL